MRTVLSALSVLLAVVLAAVAVPALWVERNIADEAGFVRLFEPLKRDAEFQTALGSSLAGTALSASGVPGPLQGPARSFTENVVQGITADPRFPAAWDETLRASHRLNFSPQTATDGAFTLELRPLAEVLLARLGDAVGVGLGPAPSITVPVGTPQQRSVLTLAQEAAALAVPLAAGAALALLLGLLFARRRGVALGWAGVGLLVVAGLYAAGSAVLGMAAGAASGQGTVASVFAGRVAPLLAEGFGPWILGVAVVGIVFVLLGIMLGARRRRLVRR